MEMRYFIFDVDGTLTPSRGKMDPDFAVQFLKFCQKNRVILVTGSDKPKTIEQVGEDIYNSCIRVYNCNANDVWQGKSNIRTNPMILPSLAHEFLSEKLSASSFPLRTGNHFEHRPGMVNFSIVGRNATLGERKLYVKYDTERNERHSIANLFNQLFPGFEAKVGGETGLDIAPTGLDKRQVFNDIEEGSKIYFFGDRMDEDGNDYPLKKKILDNKAGECYHVDSWKMTRSIIEQIV